MVPRLQSKVTKVARNANKAFDLLQKGYSRKQVQRMLGVSCRAMGGYIDTLRGGFRQEVPSFIPPFGVHDWSPARAKKVAKFTELAKAVIEGRASIKRKPKKSLDKLVLAKDKAINSLLMKAPNTCDFKIAAEVGAGAPAVRLRRRRLVEQGLIPDVSGRERIKRAQYKPERITNILSPYKIKKILRQIQPTVELIAKKNYFKHMVAFDFTNMLPEKLADEIAKRMKWKLKVFDPERIRGQVKDKLQWWINFNLQNIPKDLVRVAWNQYNKKKTISFFAPAGEAGEGSLIEVLEGLPKADLFNAKKLQEISDALALNPIQKAVLFGSSAGFFEYEIGEKIGCVESNVSQIKSRLFKRVKQLLEK